jgi:excinuclease ABC subunit A
VEKRLADSLETALSLAEGVITVDVMGREELLFSEKFACPDCGISFEEMSPRMFSFNNPYGACPTCTGLGIKLEIDPELVIPNPQKTLAQGAVDPWNKTTSLWYMGMLESLSQE